MSDLPTDREPTRDELDRFPGPLLLEFGASWCGYCQALEPDLRELLARHPEIPFRWIEDGKGKPLGRSFGVRLWPNLVLLRDGKVVAQLARPEIIEVEAGLKAITS